MTNFAIQSILGYVTLSAITFIPIIGSYRIYRKFDGKENKKIEDISACLLVFGLLSGIYWSLITVGFIVYLFTHPISIEKLKIIFIK